VSEQPASSTVNKSVVWAIVGLLLIYLVALVFFHLPQTGTEIIAEAKEQEHPEQTVSQDSDAGESAREQAAFHPPYWMALPFVLLLGAIAVLPLHPLTAHWWESNLHRFYIAGGLAAITLAYYLFLCTTPLHTHWLVHHIVRPAEYGPNLAEAFAVFCDAVLGEYIPFIVLLFSLYTISGGIRIEGDLPAHPLTNAAFLAAGAVLASFIGTTGAAMLLIRPLLDTNSERKHVRHTVIFFIFMVCNCGGLLLPIGDPPLFLGYLLGVPFLWTIHLLPEWLFVNGLLLAIYFVWDVLYCYPREAPRDIARDETRVHRLRFGGLWPNVPLLLGVIFGVALLDPSKPFPGTDWHPWLYLREMIQLVCVALSLTFGSSAVRRANRFNYAAIVEVAVLFLGIFICMQPPLQILNVRGPSLGLSSPTHFFWATGLLSSFLDNAPTYVVFFQTAKTLGGVPAIAGVAEPLLVAVSLGAVFMGANTYIGNGPNFMVKTIAQRRGVPMPGFFGYMLYSCLILLPLLALTNWLFLR